jgi:hypothetical protein
MALCGERMTYDVDEILMDVIIQACLNSYDFIIDTGCISTYQLACEYLESQGYLEKVNYRIYKIRKVREEWFNKKSEVGKE